MNLLLKQPIFQLGLLLRLALIAWVSAEPVLDWYIPFLENTATFNIDPWAVWLGKGGDLSAFPYGYVMWLVFLPLVFLAKISGLPLTLGYGLTLLAVDFSMLNLFYRLYPTHHKLILGVYWLSPIVIVATYVLGYNDLIPVFFLLLSYLCIKQFRFWPAGLAIVMAISAKFSMVLAVPFFAVFFLHNRSMWRFRRQFVSGACFGIVIFILPFVISSDGLKMLFGNAEMSKAYLLALEVGSGISIYLAPLIYLLLLYSAWRINRINYELFVVLTGVSFLSIILMTPASPGWFIWSIPLLVAYQCMSDRISIALVGIFSLLYVLSTIVPLIPIDALTVFFNADLAGVHQRSMSILHTMMVALGLVLCLRIWREAVTRNDYFRLSRKPFVLGIAGDSGAGKDTYADSIEGLFGKHSVTKLSGDDYHLWDRQKPMWQVMTHLNPVANDLDGFARDLVALTDGKTIKARHYDHTTGRMSHPQPLRSNEVIIASGLHALHLPILRDAYDLSVYLDIDEDLRKYFKIKRDVNIRGHSLEKVLASFVRREADSVRFVRPQAQHADLILSLKPIHPRLLEGEDVSDKLRLKLVARARHGFNEMALTRALVGVCGLHVDVSYSEDGSEIELTIEGETAAEDVEIGARMVCPRIFEFLDVNPDWKNGVMGLMQLITVSHINQSLTKRIL